MSDPNGSPSLLPAHPKRGPGVRRLNKVPIWIGIGATCAILGAAGWTYHLRAQSILAREAVDAKHGEAGRAAVLDGAPDDGVVLARLGVLKGPATASNPFVDPIAPNSQAAYPSDLARSGDGEDDATKARRQAWQVYYAQLADLQKQRHDAAGTAMHADTSAGGGSGAGGEGGISQGGNGTAGAPGTQQAMQAPGAGYTGGGYGTSPYGFGGSQLFQAYGQHQSITGNCHIRIIYAPNEGSTADWISHDIGNTTIVKEDVTESGLKSGSLKNVSRTYHEVSRPVMTPDEVMALRKPRKDGDGRIVQSGEMVIFIAGERPIKGTQLLYFIDPIFSVRARMPAPASGTTMRRAAKAARTFAG